MLAEFSFNLTHVENGQQAVNILREKAFDLILMDIQMPEVDGLQATKQIREILKLQTPIIALTANAMKQDIDACFDAGMNAHVGKPVDRANLVNVLIEQVNASSIA